ncbi:MAG: hypothetical protein AAF368_09430, partial [Planctomycetota bacterium]
MAAAKTTRLPFAGALTHFEDGFWLAAAQCTESDRRQTQDECDLATSRTRPKFGGAMGWRAMHRLQKIRAGCRPTGVGWREREASNDDAGNAGKPRRDEMPLDELEAKIQRVMQKTQALRQSVEKEDECAESELSASAAKALSKIMGPDNRAANGADAANGVDNEAANGVDNEAANGVDNEAVNGAAPEAANAS